MFHEYFFMKYFCNQNLFELVDSTKFEFRYYRHYDNSDNRTKHLLETLQTDKQFNSNEYL